MSKLDQLRALGPSQIGRRAAKAAAKSKSKPKVESVSERRPAKSKPRKPRSKKARTKAKAKAAKPKRGRPFSNFSKTDYQREYMRNKRVRKALGFLDLAGRQQIDRDGLNDRLRWVRVRGNRVFEAWKDSLKNMLALYPGSFDSGAKRLAKTVCR